MALTQIVCGVTKNRISFLVSHDGAAGNVLTITAAQLRAAANAGGAGANELAGFFGTQWAGNNQANARRRLLGWGGLSEVMDGVAHCRTFVRNGVALALGPDTVIIDADVDAVDPLQNELNITCSAAAAGDFQVDVEYQHTVPR